MLYQAKYYVVLVLLVVSIGIAVAQDAPAPTPIVVDAPVTATFAEGDAPRYIVSVPANTLYQIDLVSDDFDPSMILYDEEDRNIGSNQNKVQGATDAQLFVYPSEDTDYVIQVGSQSEVGDYTLSVAVGSVIIEEFAETILDVELQPGDTAFVAFPVTQNDVFNIGYNNQDSANLRLAGDLINSNGSPYGISLNGANTTSYAVLAKETENLGLLIKSPADATGPTTVTVTLTPVAKTSLDDGAQSMILYRRNAGVMTFTAEADSVYQLTVLPESGLPQSMFISFVQNGAEIGKTQLTGGDALFNSAMLNIKASESGEFLVIFSITGNINEVEFSMTISAEPMP